MKKIFLLLVAVLFCYSCNMVEEPRSQTSANTVFNTESGLTMYSKSFYKAFTTSFFLESSLYAPYNATDDQELRYLQNSYTSEDQGTWGWGTLRNINYFIVNCQNSTLSESIKANYLGLARFFRAYFYFGMMQEYGDLPWINHPLDIDDKLLYAGRDDRTLIADSIRADLDFAIANISDTKDATCSTVTKTVAAAFKSRVCLWEGTFRKYHSEYGLAGSASEWLQEAVSAAQIVMDAGYSIYTAGGNDSYHKLFLSVEPISSEVLYATTFSADLGVIHNGNRLWTSATYGNDPCPTQKFVNMYLMLDGTPFTDRSNYASTEFSDQFTNRDLRLVQTNRGPGYTRKYNGKTIQVAPDYGFTMTGYHVCKFTLPDEQYDNVDICDNNIILFRYAEVLLNYAEAKAELGILSDTDWAKTVGVLRARAGITGGLSSKPTKADAYIQKTFFPNISDPSLLEIRRERWVELCFEGFCWSDVLRWKVGELLTKEWDGIYIPELDVPYDMNKDGILDVCYTKNLNPQKVEGVFYVYVGKYLASGVVSNYQLSDNGHNLVYKKDIERVWNDKLYFHPISAEDIKLNPNLKQNPGW